MPRPHINLLLKVKEALKHCEALPPEADTPLPHYYRCGIDHWNLLEYFERHVSRPGLYASVASRHLARLNAMILVNLIEAFERFLKEVAAECVNCLAAHVLDDRFDSFRIQAFCAMAQEALWPLILARRPSVGRFASRRLG